jgi:RNA polymerase sigma factor (sigma-70 family)
MPDPRPLLPTNAVAAAGASANATVADGDLSELYGALSRRLERIVRVDVRASDAVIEDACQFAWSRLVVHRDRVSRDCALAWLARTAVREAFKLIRRDGRELSLEAVVDEFGERAIGVRTAPPDVLVERRERLRSISALPERQQRLLWLHALGLSYCEMALHTGDSRRTVERQLLRAKDRMRGLAAE